MQSTIFYTALLSVVMLTVIMLNVVTLIVVAPRWQRGYKNIFVTKKMWKSGEGLKGVFILLKPRVKCKVFFMLHLHSQSLMTKNASENLQNCTISYNLDHNATVLNKFQTKFSEFIHFTSTSLMHNFGIIFPIVRF